MTCIFTAGVVYYLYTAMEKLFDCFWVLAMLTIFILRGEKNIMRTAGILLHISSLHDRYGIGTIGKCAYDFIDFCKKSGIDSWQVLPVGPTGYGDSPYQSYSAFAGNPNLIDLTVLIEEGLVNVADPALTKLEAREYDSYEKLWTTKKEILARAYIAFIDKKDEIPDFKAFCAENAEWLDDYALYMAIKYSRSMNMWTLWEDALRRREPQALDAFIKSDAEHPAAPDGIGFWKFCQYEFYKQYAAMRAYAAKNGIRIIGDMPIYVSMDSADIWANPELFELDEDLRPTLVAGCPPDDFAKTGQLWGNPVYRWEEHEGNCFAWWIRRMEAAGKLFDLLRIDHFRGFESFYAIPADAETAENGTWKPGPGARMFEVIKDNATALPKLIAENLGFLTPEVDEMLSELELPGMNVLEFAFDGSDSGYLPHNFKPHSVSYIGTHDNDTALGWYNAQDKKTRKRIRKYVAKLPGESIPFALIRLLAASVSELVVFQMQDILGLGSAARMNTPSTIGGGNWLWQMEAGSLTDKTAARINKLLKRYFRLPPVKKVKVRAVK
jgi:4-alpha-glucanotransferase